MTREEAIRRIKAWNLDSDDIEVLAVVIPELTKWSEKDSLHLANAILSAEKEWGTESYTVKWLKSLPERFNLSPKPTWSEEERKILDSIIDDYEKASKSFCGYDGKILVLKAIRDGNLPKSAWSDEDEERLKAICTYLQDYPRLAKINDVKRFNEYCGWLKSLRPQQKKELTEEEKNKYVFDTLCALGYPIDANGNIIKYEEVFEMCKNAMVYWLQQNLQKMIARKMVDSEGIKTQTLLKESYLKAYREGIEDSIRELSSQYNKKSPQPLWKPTEEQIKAIRLARSFVVDDFSEKPTLSETLKELEEQLKKL